MNKELDLTVREITSTDFDLIANYWLRSDTEFLVGMGVDLRKLPTRSGLISMLTEQLNLPLRNKKSYALIWELDGKQIGHSNVNEITFGKQATMHLHVWKSDHRKKGIGTELVKRSLPFYFEKLELQDLYCEPYASNQAPNKTLEKTGFEFEKKYTTIPGSLNFEQEVCRWKMSREKYQEIMPHHHTFLDKRRIK